MTPPRWTPGGFEPWITLSASLILFYSMTSRGVDYLTGDSGDTARRLSTIEDAAPLAWWGAIYVLGAAIGFTALACRRPVLLMWGHGIGAACYSALAVGLAADVVQREGSATWLVVLIAITLVGLVAGPAAGRAAAAGRYAPLVIETGLVAAATGILTIPLDGLRNVTIFVTLTTLHALMLIGTAGKVRREKIIEERDHD